MTTWETSIGASLHAGTLTIAVRHGNVLDEPQSQSASAIEAAALLLELKALHRHDDPIVYLESGPEAGAVLDELYRRDKHSRDESVNGLGAPFGTAGAGVAFYDRRSELHYKFRQSVARGHLLVPAAYSEQMIAFRQTAKDGKIFFDYIEDVAARLGRFPALATAAVLAAIDAPPRGDARPKEHDPYKGSRRGHDPYAKSK